MGRRSKKISNALEVQLIFEYKLELEENGRKIQNRVLKGVSKVMSNPLPEDA